jgi:hypothetical protein
MPDALLILAAVSQAIRELGALWALLEASGQRPLTDAERQALIARAQSFADRPGP